MLFSSAPNDWLMHHGIKGQKWGIRRYQNPDGTLTAEGRKRYGLNDIAKPKNIGNLSKRERKRLALKEYNKMADKQSKFDDELYEEYGNNKTAVKQMDKLSKDAFKQGIKAINEIYDVDLNKTFMARRALALASLASIATVAVSGKLMYNRTTNERMLNETKEELNAAYDKKEFLDYETKMQNKIADHDYNIYNSRKTELRKLNDKMKDEQNYNRELNPINEFKKDVSENNKLKAGAERAAESYQKTVHRIRQLDIDSKYNDKKIEDLQNKYDYLDKHPYKIK